MCFVCLKTLATTQGNILENKELIESLNQTKASSALIHQSLTESHRLQTSLDQVMLGKSTIMNKIPGMNETAGGTSVTSVYPCVCRKETRTCR